MKDREHVRAICRWEPTDEACWEAHEHGWHALCDMELETAVNHYGRLLSWLKSVN